MKLKPVNFHEISISFLLSERDLRNFVARRRLGDGVKEQEPVDVLAKALVEAVDARFSNSCDDGSAEDFVVTLDGAVARR